MKHINNNLSIDTSSYTPLQKIGKSCDNLVWKELDSEKYFEKWKTIYFGISDWADFAGKEKAHFTLTNAQGVEINRKPVKGDLVRIKLSLIQNIFRNKEEWVEIVDLEEVKELNFQLVKMTFAPTQKPTKNKKYPQHFLTNVSSNTFIIARKGNVYQASVHGRNELVNTEVLPNPLKFLRNQFIARTGFAGLSSWQWQSWCEGVLKALVEK